MSPVPFLRRDGDEALARRVARGDQAACSALFHRYHPRLELYCRSITRNDADAQDAAQSALAKAFAALEARAPESALRPWLFRIAHNEAVSLLRRRRPEGEIAPELAHHDRGPGETVELREELRNVLADLSELPPRAREALLLRELADLDYAAVGDVLGISPGGARQAVFEARLALQADRAGREAPCEGIRQELSDCDTRRRPTRRARGHLRGCSACRSWRQAQAQRRRALALAPGLPLAGGAWAWLAALGSGGTVATTGAGAGTKVAVGLAALAAGTAPVAVVERELHDDAPAEARAASGRATGAAARERAADGAAPARAAATSGTAVVTGAAALREVVLGGTTASGVREPAGSTAREEDAGGTDDAGGEALGRRTDRERGGRTSGRGDAGEDGDRIARTGDSRGDSAGDGTDRDRKSDGRPDRASTADRARTADGAADHAGTADRPATARHATPASDLASSRNDAARSGQTAPTPSRPTTWGARAGTSPGDLVAARAADGPPAGVAPTTAPPA